MLFNSTEFMLFFPVVVLIYFILPKKVKQFWLLLSSYYFYMCWNAKYAILILFSTVVTYFSGLLLDKQNALEGDNKGSRDSAKKWIVAGSVVVNLAVLFYFKYFNFFLGSIAKVFAIAHISLNIPTFDILLPVGISFYTFQALSYTIDLYHDDVDAEKNFFKYALFVSFFPQLVAGPIERSKNLLHQLDEPKKFDFDNAREGVLLMIWGFFLKIVLADRIALLVDTVYNNYAEYQGWYLVIATFLFSIQIYCDFYGYSVIAMGTAKVLGVTLMENFDAPYLSGSVREFWNRWHISLSSWLRDYLFNPLAMKWNRRLATKPKAVRKKLKKLPSHAALIVTFLASGLWHGANWSFVVWGLIHGLYQLVGDWTTPIRKKLQKVLNVNTEALSFKGLQILGTFILVTFSYIFFRANSMHDAIEIIKGMFAIRNPWIMVDGSLYTLGLDINNFWLMIIGIEILFIADVFKYRGVVIRQKLIEQDGWFQVIAVVFAIAAILTFGIWGPGYVAANFIYFQF